MKAKWMQNLLQNKIALVLSICVWAVAIFLLFTGFAERIVTQYYQVQINDDTGYTTLMQPGDVLTQEFFFEEQYPTTLDIAFICEDAVREKASVMIQLYCGEEIVMEQPLPLLACPPSQFLSFGLGDAEYDGRSMMLRIENTSADAEGSFSVLSTHNVHGFNEYSEGYLINGNPFAESVLCRFHFLDGANYYPALTFGFNVIISAVLLSALIWRVSTWLRQRKSR